MTRGRGRPRQYDEAQAIQAAGQVFWAKGFSATSLDDLSVAMAMNRPSIYRAFGDKESIYRKALAQFRQGMEVAFERTILTDTELGIALTEFFTEAVAIYMAGPQPKGCMVMSTAATVAIEHPEVQADLLALIRELDKKLTARFKRAQVAGQISATIDADSRAMLAQSLLHSLSLRARAGESAQRLQQLIRAGTELLMS